MVTTKLGRFSDGVQWERIFHEEEIFSLHTEADYRGAYRGHLKIEALRFPITYAGKLTLLFGAQISGTINDNIPQRSHRATRLFLG